MRDRLRFGSRASTLAADYTLEASAPIVHALDPGGATRKVLLPTANESLFFVIANTADAAEDLTLRDAGDTTTLATLVQGDMALLFCDAANWHIAPTKLAAADALASFALNSAGLAISGGSADPGVATGGSTTYLTVAGTLRSIGAATNLPALVGTVVNATFNVFCFFLDAAGNPSVAMGTAGATLDAVVFPAFPTGQALIGFVIINPTGTGNFVGGTTDLDDATVVPNAVFVNPTAPFKPALTA